MALIPAQGAARTSAPENPDGFPSNFENSLRQEINLPRNEVSTSEVPLKFQDQDS